MRREANIPGEFEIPMQYLTTTIEFILTQYGFDGINVDALTKEEIESAIEFSGYINSETYSEMN